MSQSNVAQVTSDRLEGSPVRSFKFVIPLCYIYNMRHKMPSGQLVYAIYLMCQHVSPSKGHRQDDGIIYIRRNVYNFNYVKARIAVLQIC
jgi:hypothetical protein